MSAITRGVIFSLFLLSSLRQRETLANVRRKRFVAFRKGSTFFYRINYKLNTIPHTTLFAQASGFKVAWELPTTKQYRKARALSFDDIEDSSNFIYDNYEFNGKVCLMKSLCQTSELLKEKDGILMKILNLLAGSESENNTSNLDPLSCKSYGHNCPLQFTGFNIFTENL